MDDECIGLCDPGDCGGAIDACCPPAVCTGEGEPDESCSCEIEWVLRAPSGKVVGNNGAEVTFEHGDLAEVGTWEFESLSTAGGNPGGWGGLNNTYRDEPYSIPPTAPSESGQWPEEGDPPVTFVVECPEYSAGFSNNSITSCETSEHQTDAGECIGTGLSVSPNLIPGPDATGSPLFIDGTVHPQDANGVFFVETTRIPDVGGEPCPTITSAIFIDGGNDDSGGGARGSSGCSSECGSSGGGGGVGGGRVRNPGGVDFLMSMGHLDAENGAGAVFLRSILPNEKFRTPVGLEYTVLETTAVTLRDATTTAITQIESGDTVMQTEVIDDDSWKIKVWEAGNSNLGTPDGNGYYAFATSPISEWRFYYTPTLAEIAAAGGSPPTNRRLQIDKVVGGTVRAEYYFDGTVDSKDWTLTVVDPDAPASSDREVPYMKIVSWPQTNVRRTEIKHGPLGSEVSDQVIEETYSTLSLSYGDVDRITQRVVDPDGTTPLTTTIAYYDGTAGVGEQGQVKSIQYPDGNWVYYYYDSSTGKRTDTYGPYGNQAYVSDPAVGSGTFRRTNYDYDSPESGTPTDTGEREPQTPRVITKYIGSDAVSRSYRVYADDVATGTDIEEVAATPSSAFGAAANLRTTTYYLGDPDEVFAIAYPDGRWDEYVYEKGDFTYNASDPASSTFSANGTGPDSRTFVIHGTSSYNGGVSGRTTRDVYITDRFGRQVMSQTDVKYGGSYTNIDYTVNKLDSQGRVIRIDQPAGQVTLNSYNCCYRDSVTAPDGTITDYEHDALGRVIAETKTGVSASGGYAAQTDIVTRYEYDGLDRRTKTTLENASATLALETESVYYSNGRLHKEIDAAGLETVYTYQNNGLTVTSTAPGGLTTIRARNTDGMINSVTGTAVVHEYHTYGWNSSGEQYTQVNVSSSSSPRYTKTWTDFVGRQFKVERPAYPTGTLESTTEYEPGTGLIEKRTAPGQPDTLYEYDAYVPWQVFRTVSDLNDNGTIDLATDRVTETVSSFEIPSAAWRVSKTWIYPIDSDGSTKTLVSESHEQLTGFTGDVVGVSKSIDLHGNESVTTTEIDSSGRLTTVTSTIPTSNTSAVSISRNGLQQTSTDYAGHLTSFTHDSLGRRIAQTDSRSATTSTFYNATTGRIDKIQVPDGASGVAETVFTYNGATGRRTSIENADGKKTYLGYSDRGEVVKVWGDVAQPVKIGFNAYGERTTLTTYRTGDFTGTTWPGSEPTGDVTTWAFHEATGLLESKTDAASKAVSYIYKADGRLEKRTWSRHVTSTNEAETTYGYDTNTFQLTSITYSDGVTPNVSITHDRLGRVKTITDGAGTHTMAYNADLQLDYEEIDDTTNGLFDNARITRLYEDGTSGTVEGRYAGYEMGTDSDADLYGAVGYGYDDKGRFGAVTGPGLTAGGALYNYRSDSDLIDELHHLDGSSGVIAKTVNTYESKRPLITSVTHSWESPTQSVIAAYTYENDELGRRKHRVNDLPGTSDDSNDQFGYNDRNELIASSRWTGTNPAAFTTKIDEYGFDYDPIGNLRFGTDKAGNESAYLSNNLNQYEVISRPGIQCTIDESQELTASDYGVNDAFATAQRFSGDWMIVGAPKDDDSGTDAGAVYIFEKSATWSQDAKIVHGSVAAGDEFGFSTAIDGDVALIGAPKTNSSDGAVYIYRESSGTWSHEATLSGSISGGQFGHAVAIDGDVAVISAPYAEASSVSEAGQVYVYRYDDSVSPAVWALEDTIVDPNKTASDHFGMALTVEGDILAVGSPHDDVYGSIVDGGTVMPFKHNGSGDWTQMAYLNAGADMSAGDEFGADVAFDVDVLVIGAPKDDIDGTDSGLAHLFTVDLGTGYWYKAPEKFRAGDAAAGDEFGTSVAVENGRVVIGSKNDDDNGADSGSAYLYGQINGEWRELAKLAATGFAPGDHLGGGKADFENGFALFGAPDSDAVASNAGAAYTFDVTDQNGNNVPDPCDDEYTYDADGNLLEDENFTYVWDGENRLVQVDAKAANEGVVRVTYAYDYAGRRVRRVGWTNDGGYAVETDTRYLYDGWNVAIEFKYDDLMEQNVVRKTYTWGLDLSGSLQGAGGVGGLLACEDLALTHSSSDDVSFLYQYDANGNVMTLVNSADGDVLGRYGYDPYGSAISIGSGFSFGYQPQDDNTYRFSTKPLDAMTGLYYYGYRYYSPAMRRWFSRDPIGERGGAGLYTFAASRPTDHIDPLGTTPEESGGNHGTCTPKLSLEKMPEIVPGIRDNEKSVHSSASGEWGWIFKGTYSVIGSVIANDTGGTFSGDLIAVGDARFGGMPQIEESIHVGITFDVDCKGRQIELKKNSGKTSLSNGTWGVSIMIKPVSSRSAGICSFRSFEFSVAGGYGISITQSTSASGGIGPVKAEIGQSVTGSNKASFVVGTLEWSCCCCENN